MRKINYNFNEKIIKIAKKINNNNGKMYLVGGAVRDYLIGKKNYDEDYCVIGITKQGFQKMFPNAYLNGRDFPVFRIDDYEIALARKERKKGKRHFEFEIETDKTITILEDLKRRDITINAIAVEVLTGEVIDPYDGIKDITNKKIRAVSEAFKEDSLRVYRVARFSAKLNYEIEDRTIEMMKSMKNELVNISKERIYCELKKALKTDKPSRFFDSLRKADALNIHFEEINNLIGVEQPLEYHPEGDAYNHTMKAIDNARKMTNKEEYVYAVLVHDLGKGITPKEEYPHHINHDKNGVELVQNLSTRIGVPKMWKQCGMVSAKQHMRAGRFNEMRESKKVDFIEEISKSKLGLEGMKVVVKCDILSSNNNGVEEIQFDKIGKKILFEINGDFIKNKYNLESGVKVKEKLREERIFLLKTLNKKSKIDKI